MQRSSSFLNNRRRIRRVLDHMIDSSLARLRGDIDDRTNLDTLADIACWSGEHLVRAWHTIFGQPPLATARRIQLDFAAQALRRGEPIAYVAANSGYASGQAFAHAFSRQFNMCASTFLRRGPDRPVQPMRIIRLDEPLVCLAVPYSGICRDGYQTFDGMLNTLTRSGSNRAEWDVFSVVDDESFTINLDCHVSFHAAVLEQSLRVPVRGLDRIVLPAATYAVFDRPFEQLPYDPERMLIEHGWRRTGAQRFHQFITDPARTIPSKRRDRRWIPVEKI